MHEQPVALVGHQPQQGALELVEPGLAVPIHTDVHRAFVKAVEGIVHGLVRVATGEAPHVDHWQLVACEIDHVASAADAVCAGLRCPRRSSREICA